MVLPVQVDIEMVFFVREEIDRSISKWKAQKELFELLRTSLTNKTLQQNSLFGFNRFHPPEGNYTWVDRSDWARLWGHWGPGFLRYMDGKRIFKFERRFLLRVTFDIWKLDRFNFHQSVADGTAVVIFPPYPYLDDRNIQRSRQFRIYVRAQAIDFVKSLEDRWIEGEVLTINLFDGSQFRWERYLEQLRWGRTMLMGGVTSIFLVWVAGTSRGNYNCGGFYVKYGVYGTENVIFPKHNCTCEDAVHFICWDL
jgi:hypothetical protein